MPKADEIEKLKERIKSLSDDERNAVLEALEPDILQKVKALISGFKPAPKDDDDDGDGDKKKKRPWWQL